MALITKSDISTNRQLSNSVKDEIINPSINDAESDDLAPLLGEIFYNAISDDSGSFTDLLDGGTYTHDSNTYSHPGIKKVLVDFAYARHIMFGGQTDTPFGFVEKESQNSSNVSRDSKKEKYKALRQSAILKWERVKNFLDRKSADFPLWESCKSTHNGFFRASKITV